MNYKQLKELLSQHECRHLKTHLTACITFSSFGSDGKKDDPWYSRTYTISSGNKAFQPNMGGYSIFGNSLDGRDRGVRLERYMQEEHGGKDGWVVEDCFLVGYLLIKFCDIGGTAAKLFYSHDEAAENMLSQLAELGELNFEQLKKDYSAANALFGGDAYGADRECAWLTGSCEDWHWSIKLVYIHDLLNMVFPDDGGHIEEGNVGHEYP